MNLCTPIGVLIGSWDIQLLDAIVDKLENARSSPDGESEFTVGECDTINHTVMHMMKCTRMYVCRSRVLIKFENSST